MNLLSSRTALSRTVLLVLLAGACAAASAQQTPKPETLIKWRQSAFQVLAWNSGRIKASLDAGYNREEVAKSAAIIASLANGSLGELFPAGTETGKGWHDTTVKPALFTDGKRTAELAGNFAKEATALQAAASTGEVDAVRAQYARLGQTCKACHDAFRNTN
jgi:cytochrome c556